MTQTLCDICGKKADPVRMKFAVTSSAGSVSVLTTYGYTTPNVPVDLCQVCQVDLLKKAAEAAVKRLEPLSQTLHPSVAHPSVAEGLRSKLHKRLSQYNMPKE